jgi:hypothetical protein
MKGVSVVYQGFVPGQNPKHKTPAFSRTTLWQVSSYGIIMHIIRALQTVHLNDNP